MGWEVGLGLGFWIRDDGRGIGMTGKGRGFDVHIRPYAVSFFFSSWHAHILV